MKKHNNQMIQNGARLREGSGSRTDRQILERHAGVQERVHGYVKRGKLRRFIAILSAFVLLFTLNSLKFKADTLQHLPMCGMEEHVHTEACYDEAGGLVCGIPEHTHTDACYQQRPVKPEPTVFDEFMDVNSQVVLASPMEEEVVDVASESVDEAVDETTLDLEDGAEGSAMEGAADDSAETFTAEASADDGLEVEYDLDDLYDENGDETVVPEVTIEDDTDIEDNYDDADDAVAEYGLNGGSTAFLSDVLRAAGLEISGITAVSEISGDAFVQEHIAVEPVEGVDDEYVISVLQSFDRVLLGVANDEGIETVWLTNGQAVAAPEEVPATSDEVVEDVPAVEDVPTEDIELDDEIINSNEINETEQKQTEVGEIETEVGEADAAPYDGETTEAAPTEDDESVTDVTDASDAQVVEDVPAVEDQSDDAQVDDTPAAEDQNDDAQVDDTPAVEDQNDDAQVDDTPAAEDQNDDAQVDDTPAVEDQNDDAQVDDTPAVEDQGEDAQVNDTPAVEDQGDDAQVDDTPAVEDQNDDAQVDDTPAVEDQSDDAQVDDTPAAEDQNDDAQVDDTPAAEDQGDDAQVSAAPAGRTITLDFTNYSVEDAHTVYLYDAEMGAVLVNAAEIDAVDGVAVTMPDEGDEEAPVAEGGVLIIEGDGTYALEGATYAVTGLVIPGKATGDEAQVDDAQADDAPAGEDQGAADGQDEQGEQDETVEPDEPGEPDVPAVAAESTVTLDFTDYVATDAHDVYLYDASMVAVLVSEAEIASADGVAVTREEAAEADEAQAEEAPAGEAAAEDAQAREGTLIITGDGEYALDGTTYVVTGLVLPEKTVENENITITTANDEATLLNVAPVFEETDEDYDDIFSLFTMAQDDPTLLAKVFDLLGGVAYAEEGEAGRDLNVRVFKIGLEDVTTGEAVEPGTELHVVSSLDTPISGEDFQLYHIADGKPELIPDAVVVEDGRAVGLSFNTVSLDKFALVYYTVNVMVEDKNITVDVDFTDVVANGVDFDNQTILTALNEGVAIDVASLLAGDADGALNVNVEGDALNVNAAALSVEPAGDGEPTESGVTYADGSVRVTGDGSVVLTDGEYTLNIVVTNYSKLLADRLEADGVSVEVVEGEVPAGSTVTYEALSADETEALVKQYIGEAEQVDAPEQAADAPEQAAEAPEQAAEAPEQAAAEASGETVEEPRQAAEGAAEVPGANQTEEKNEIETATGYTAFDVSIAMPEGDEFTKDGQFAVTVDHAVDAASLVPEGAVIDNITYELFHIHNGEATQIEDVAVAAGQVSFTTDGFSEYVIRYTVEFHNGENEVVIKGGSQVLLSTLIDKLGLTRENGDHFTVDEVESVRFVNPELFTVEEVTESPVTVNGEAVELTTAHDFLLTSEQPFDADQMILTLKDEEVEVEVTDDNPQSHTTNIIFLDSNYAAQHTNNNVAPEDADRAIPEPQLTDHYYLLAAMDRGGNSAYYSLIPVDTLNDMTGTQTSVNINTLDHCTDADVTVPYTIQSGDTIVTRLLRSGTELSDGDLTVTYNTESTENQLLDKLAYSNRLQDKMETGYDFAKDDGGNPANNIYIHRTDSNYKYKVRLRFNEGATTPILHSGDGGNDTSVFYYVFLRVYHQKTGVDYGLANVEITADELKNLPMDEEGYLYLDKPIDHWLTKDKTIYDNIGDYPDKFTGNETKIDVKLIKHFKSPSAEKASEIVDVDGGTPYFVEYKKATVYGFLDEDYPNVSDKLSSYTVTYDTKDTRGDTSYYTETVGDTIWCYDQITLTSDSITADYDYAAILGPNIEYGIVAEHLFQGNHLQTNFAVNHFSAHGADVRPDLSGEKPGNIVIAQFNVVDGDRRNAVGNVAYDEVWGRLKIGKPLNGTLMVYVDQDSGYPEGSVYDNPDDTIIVPSNGPSLSENIVEPGIEYMKRISAELLSKPCTLTPSFSSTDNKITIDTTGYDENATIYINGDLIEKFIENSGGLNIKKKDGQLIVFNFFKKTNDELNIKQFVVNGQKTESPEATGTHQNTWMDDVARHIVWNLAGRIRQVNIDTAGGIFLQPNDDSNIDIQGTTAGWIVSDGYVYNSTAEWHNVYEEMPDSVKVNLFAVKYLDKKVPSNDVKFKFKLEKLTWTLGGDESNHWRTYDASNPWKVLQAEANNANQQVSFRTVEHSELDLGWNIFRITETKGDDNYIYDDHVFYAAVLMEKLDETTARLHNIDYRVSRPQYYSSFEPNDFRPLTNGSLESYNTLLTGVSGRVAYPEYNNETITTGLTLMKKVDGTDATNKQFTFTVKLWTENPAGTNHPLTEAEQASLTHAGVANADWTIGDVGDVTVVTVKLRNGRKVTIGGLTEGMHYHVEETAIGNETVSARNDIQDNYQVIGVDSDGNGEYEYFIDSSIDTSEDAVSVVYNNKYTSAGQKDFTVHKTMVNKDSGDVAMPLVAGQFKFTLSGDGKTLVGYNDADGNVVFDELDDSDPSTHNNHLSFTQEDMADAKRNNQGYLEKEITYVITESEPNTPPANLPAGFDYNKVIYDKDKTITLVLTDEGNGTIKVTPKNGDTALGVQFENGYMEKATATLEGKKTLEGRQLNKAEFLFDARLIKVGEYNVSAEAIAAEENADQAAFLRNKRQQADPIDVIGHNKENHTPDAEGGKTYTGNIVFPTIYYTAVGTYVYKITENTTNMPVGVTQKEGTTITYYAKVEVNSLSTEPSVSYYTDEDCTESLLGDDVVFTNEAEDIYFSVTKEVYNAAGSKVTNCEGKTITFEVYKDGSPIVVNDTMLTVDTGVDIVEGGKVKLTGTTTGWPTANFYNMAPGRYTVKETEWTGFSSGTPSITYEMTVNDETTSSAIRQSGSEMKIINTETEDKYARIKVEKVWEDGDHNPLSDIAGSVQFTLQTVKTTGASGGGSGDTLNIKFEGGDLNDYWPTGKTGKAGSQKIVVTVGCILNNHTDFFANKLGNSNGPRVDVKYCQFADFSGSEQPDDTYLPTASATVDTYDSENGMDLIFEVPIKDFEVNSAKALSMKLNFQIGDCSSKTLKSADVVSAGDPVVVRSSRTITLSAANGWKWDGGYLPISTNGGSTTYKYRIKEVTPENVTNVTYDPANDPSAPEDVGWSGWITKDNFNSCSTFTMTNTVENPVGALKITKLVRYNSYPTNGSEVDGDYIFSVTSESASQPLKFVKINVLHGQANSYQVASANTSEAWGEATSVRQSYAIVGDLTPGSYVVEELAPDNGSTLLSAERGDEEKDAVDENKVTVVVSANDTSAVNHDAQAVFTNNKDEESGALTIMKAVTEGCDAEASDKLFTFVVALTPKSGVTIDASMLKLNNSGIASGNISINPGTGVVTVTVKIKGANSATLSNIPVETTYEVTETDLPDGWVQQGTVGYDDTYKKIAANDNDEVTVTNKAVKPFSFTKQWRDGSTTYNQTWPQRPNSNGSMEDVPIEITLKRRLPPKDNSFNPKVEDEDFSFTYTVTSAGATPTNANAPEVIKSETEHDYTFSMSGLQKYGSFTKDGVEYSGEFEYYVVETPMDFYNTTYLANNNDASTGKQDAMNGEIVRNTEIQTYELPSTGGHGTTIFYILGSILTLVAAVLLITKRRIGASE